MLGRTGDPSTWLLPTSPRTLLTHPPSNSFCRGHTVPPAAALGRAMTIQTHGLAS